MLKIATWNICLGLKNKKEYVKQMIKDHNIDICCIQECEIRKDYPKDLLSFKNFNIEVEQNSVKARCCIYVKDNVVYTRKEDLEGVPHFLKMGKQVCSFMWIKSKAGMKHI